MRGRKRVLRSGHQAWGARQTCGGPQDRGQCRAHPRPKGGAGPRGLSWDAGGLAASWTPIAARPGSITVASRWNSAALAATAPTSTLGFLSWLRARLRSLKLLDHLESAVKTPHKLETPGCLCVEVGGQLLCGLFVRSVPLSALTPLAIVPRTRGPDLLAFLVQQVL